MLANMAVSRWYWLALLVLGLALEAAALYFQYVMDYPPCALCIHVRILVLGVILVALFALAVYRTRTGRLAAHLLTALLLGVLTQRAWLLLGIERGFVEGECGFDLGLPSWLPLDQWFPAMFQVHTTCGYTPLLPLGFSIPAEPLFRSGGTGATGSYSGAITITSANDLNFTAGG